MIVVIPMAGRGSRFKGEQIVKPKPLHEVAGRPLVDWALDAIRALPVETVVFVALREHDEAFGVEQIVRGLPGEWRSEVVLLDDVTEGQLCTVLAAREFIREGVPLLVGNCDTFVEPALPTTLVDHGLGQRGTIIVADMPGDRWSFALTDENGALVKVAEKVRISDEASTGHYYFADGGEFLHYADAIVADQERAGGEYYVIPVYNRYVDDGKLIRTLPIQRMWDLGTPDALDSFVRRYLQS